MSHTLHYKVSIIGALISSIAFTALAVFAIAPGETLDPAHPDSGFNCDGPTDVTCIVNPYENLDPASVLYLDGNGDITTDINFVRSGEEFFVGGEFSIYDSNLDIYTDLHTSFSMGDDLGTILGNLPGVGMLYTQDDYVSFMGIVDATNGPPEIQTKGLINLSSANNDYISAFLLAPDGTIAISSEANNFDNSSRLQITYDELILDHSFDDDTDNTKITLNPDGVKFSFLNDSESYIFPIIDGDSGEVLKTNGAGQLSWGEGGGGSSPIEIVNNTNLFSTGLDAGLGASSSSFSNAIFLGNDSGALTTNAADSNFIGASAGYNATSASSANFIGASAGANATSASSANFIGASAGSNATSAFFSNFIGSAAGAGASLAVHSNFIGSSSGRVVGNQGSTKASQSIFIGRDANVTVAGADLDNTASNVGDSCNISGQNCYSILLGNYTSTGGKSNSIAIGAYAANTAENQFMVGSTTRGINEMIVQGSSTNSVLTTGTAWSHPSDERIKTNIVDLSSVLDEISNIRTVSYNRISDPEGERYIGFLAQNLELAFPELVRTNRDGYKSVYYELMTPILTQAIKELDLKINILEQQTISEGGFSLSSLSGLVKDVLADVGNGIQNIFAKRVTTEELCVEDVCFDKEEAEMLKQLIHTGIITDSDDSEEGDVIIDDEEVAPEEESVTDEDVPLVEEEPITEIPEVSESEDDVEQSEIVDEAESEDSE